MVLRLMYRESRECLVETIERLEREIEEMRALLRREPGRNSYRDFAHN